MRATASLSIRSTVLTSDFISRCLNLDATDKHEKGDPVSPKRYPNGPFHKHAYWGFQSGLSYTASLADHLRSLVEVIDSRREALRLLQADSWTDFSAGLFGERETIASFQIPAEVVKWCSEVLEIALDCYTPYSDETDEDQASDADSRTDEPDRAFCYIARAGTQPLSFLSSRETNSAASDELLPRTIAAPATVVSSDLPETALVPEHLERAISLLRLRHARAGFEQNLQVVCMFTTERGTGSIVTLELPILQQMAEVGAAFRIDVHQAPSVLRRLRQAR